MFLGIDSFEKKNGLMTLRRNDLLLVPFFLFLAHTLWKKEIFSNHLVIPIQMHPC